MDTITLTIPPKEVQAGDRIDIGGQEWTVIGDPYPNPAVSSITYLTLERPGDRHSALLPFDANSQITVTRDDPDDPDAELVKDIEHLVRQRDAGAVRARAIVDLLRDKGVLQ